MATKTKTPKKSAPKKKGPPLKAVKFVKRSMPEGSLIYTPGQGVPGWMATMIDQKVKEGIDQEIERRRQNQEARGPISAGEAIVEILSSYASVEEADRDLVICSVLETIKATREDKYKALDYQKNMIELKALEAQVAVYDFDKILRGDFKIIRPSVTGKTTKAQ